MTSHAIVSISEQCAAVTSDATDISAEATTHMDNIVLICIVKSMIRDLEEDRDRQMRMSDGWLRQRLPIVLDEMD